MQAVATMMQGTVVEVDASLAVSAAKASLQFQLPLADSLILATAKMHGAILWTQDADFEGLPGVRYVAKRPHP